MDSTYWSILEGELLEIRNLRMRVPIEAQLRDDDAAEDDGLIRVEELQGVTLMYLSGPIAPEADWWMRYRGGIPLDELDARIDKFAESSNYNLVMVWDSPGGSVQGLADTSKKIRNLRKTKNVVSYAKGTMASAAYLLGSQANTLVAGSSALVGNIGTIAIMLEFADMLKENGVGVEIFRSTPLKGAGNGYEKFSDAHREEFQRIVNFFNNQFVEEVAQGRNISLETVRTKMADAKIHPGKEAVENGFADAVATLDEVVAGLTEPQVKFDTLSAKYTDLKGQYEALVSAFNGITGKYVELQSKYNDQIAAAQTEKVEAAVKELTLPRAQGGTGKVPVAKADDLRARLNADFDGTMAAMELIADGTAEPDQTTASLEQAEPPKEDETYEQRVANAKAQNKLIAFSQEEYDELTLLAKNSGGVLKAEDVVLIERK